MGNSAMVRNMTEFKQVAQLKWSNLNLIPTESNVIRKSPV